MANSRSTTNGTSTRGGGSGGGRSRGAQNNTSNNNTNTANNTSGSGVNSSNTAANQLANSNLETKPKDPMDFETLPLSALRKYRSIYKLSTPSAQSMNGYLLGGSIGKKTYSYKHSSRVSKSELAAAVKRHFMNTNTKESETIVDFIYSVRKQDSEFKLQFKP